VANVFDKVIDFINKPIVGGEKTASKTEVQKAPEKEAEAIDVTAALRKRDLDLKKAQSAAKREEDKELAIEITKMRRELRDLRREYEMEVAKEAEAHAKVEEWTHTVVPGDTLSGIAVKYYEDASRWPEIYEANKDLIKNPNLIYPGQTFVIPDDDEDE
jgi:nucleoid-associated protein YgaU